MTWKSQSLCQRLRTAKPPVRREELPSLLSPEPSSQSPGRCRALVGPTPLFSVPKLLEPSLSSGVTYLLCTS